jgi:hypothetical protein
MTSRLPLLFLAALLHTACKKASAPEPPRATKPVPQTLVVEKAVDDDDPSWIAGTWKKDGQTRWLLFNLPADVAELAGAPPRMVRRGKLSRHGRFLSVLFPDEAYDLEASRDHAVLKGAGGIGTYRRGAPP